MKAPTLISLQLIAIIVMIGCGSMVFKSILATTLFVLAFFLFIRCSIYIEKNAKRLLRECNQSRSE